MTMRYDGPDGIFEDLHGGESALYAVWCYRHQQYEYIPRGMQFDGDCGIGDSDYLDLPDWWDEDDNDYHASWRDGQDDEEELMEYDPERRDRYYDLQVAGRALDFVPATYLNGHPDLAEQF